MARRLYTLLYILALVTTIAAQRPQYAKLSPMLRHLVRDGKPATGSQSWRLHGKGGQTVCAFIRIDGDADEVLRENGCRSLAHAGNIHIANIPMNSISSLSNDSRVLRIEANKGKRLLLDTMAYCVNAVPVYEGLQLPQAYTGKNVVMGVMDVGFDLTHPTFYSRDMTQYRIHRLWDMLSQDTVGSPLYVGRDYIGKEVLLDLGCCRDGHIQGHGTHTLGIAAGSGYNTNYRGVAYESDICIVANAVSDDVALIDSADIYKYTFATDALGFKYIFDYAQQMGKPCVISFSEGSTQDFWGYDQLYYEMLDSLVGPGRILVSAAGNHGLDKSWFRKPEGQTSAGTFIRHSRKNMMLTLKAARDFTIRLISYTDDGDTLMIQTRDVVEQEDSTLVTPFPFDGSRHTIRALMEAYPSCYGNDETCYDLTLTADEAIGIIPLSVEILGEEADVEVYRYNGVLYGNDLNPELDAAECTHNILSPSSAPCVICVGNSAYRDGFRNHLGQWITTPGNHEGLISPFSSVGPTYDGRTKPDVVAPGTAIISSYSSFTREEHHSESDMNWDVAHFDFNGRTYPWQAEAGTSMSCPAVAGVIALWLQAVPTLTREQIMDVFERTCRRVDPTLSYPNNIYGFGEIDAYAGLLDILGISAIKDLSHEQSPARFSIHGNRLMVTLPTTTDEPLRLRLYTLGGQCLIDQTLPKGQPDHTIPLPALPTAVYAIQLDGPPALLGSSLIRL